MPLDKIKDDESPSEIFSELLRIIDEKLTSPSLIDIEPDPPRFNC